METLTEAQLNMSKPKKKAGRPPAEKTVAPETPPERDDSNNSTVASEFNHLTDGLVPIFIKSELTDAITETDASGKKVKFQKGCIIGNGIEKFFKIECDRTVMVEPDIADALKSLIDYQSGRR